MRLNKPLFFSCLVLSFCLTFCNKNLSTAPSNSSQTGTTIVPPKLHINLSYLLKQSTIVGSQRTNYELVVSDAGGDFLFDTISNYNVTISTDLQTSLTLVDVSVIYLSSPLGGAPQFTVNTYKSVSLADWKNLPLSDSALGVSSPVVSGTATLTLLNVGAPTPFDWQFMSNDNPGPVTSPEGVSYSNRLLITYPYEQDQYAYLAFPYNGLYKLHKIQGTNDSVDLSNLDTAIELSFKWPAEYNINTLIYGYLDSTDLSKSLLIAPGHGDYTHNYSYEAMYPGKKAFQKYDLALIGNPVVFNPSLSLQAAIRWSYLDTIPLNIPFPDESYFSVNSKTPDTFSVSFLKEKPTYYTFSSSFGSGHNFLITASGDSTALDPEKILAMLVQGKLLKGQNPAMFINGFTFVMDAEPNYQNYMQKQADMSMAYTRPLSNQVTLGVGLGGQGGAETTRFFNLSSIPSRR